MQSINTKPTPTRRSFLTSVLAGTATSVFLPKLSLAKTTLANLKFSDATAMAEMVRTGQVSPAELTEIAIQKIKKFQPTLNVLATSKFEAALQQVQEPYDRNAPFAGVPYLLKDLLEYPGIPYQSGTRMFAGHISDWTSDYVRETEKSGLVVLGKTTTPEFGLSATTEPLLTGITRNPWNTDYSTGGSSGGAAAAVAARLVPFAHASDGGGSIRIPASLCGVFGLKPSRGRQVNSRKSGMPGDISVDHCVSLSVRDSAKLLSLTEQKGHDAPLKPTGFINEPDSKRLKIKIIIPSYYGGKPDPEVEQSILATAKLCESLGHTVEEGSWPFDGAEFAKHFMAVWSSGAAGVAGLYEKMKGSAPDETVLEPWTLGLAQEFYQKPKDALPNALAYFSDLSTVFDKWFTEQDLVLSPVAKWSGLPLGKLASTVEYGQLRADMIDFASYTPAQNAAGVPAMSVPLGWSKNNLPIGSQFIAARGNEAMLLSLAYELEAAQPWIDKIPQIIS